MAKIGIYQVDGKLPNLALMQITSYHEQKGDDVEWYQGLLFARWVNYRPIFETVKWEDYKYNKT